MQEGRLHNLPSLEGNPPSHHDEKDRGKSDDPQAAHLKKKDGDHLSEKRETLSNVDRGQPGYANGGSGCEKGVDERNGVLCRRKGQPQEQSAQEDIARKTQDENALGR